MRVAILAVISLSTFIAGIAVNFSWLIEKKLEFECSGASAASEACMDRMRAMGHVWSYKGDLARAQFWYAKSANAGDPKAMFHLAWVYEEMAHQDFAAEIQRAAQSAGSGATESPTAIDMTAAEHPNIAQAVDWYRKSAGKGFAPAMNNLGELYREGLGEQQNFAEAFRWHMLAAKAGNPVAAWNVSLAYSSGQGVAANIRSASEWSLWSAKAGPTADLDQPTLERTHFFGASLPPFQCAALRRAANEGTPIGMNVEPIQPDSRIPTFEQATGRVRPMQPDARLPTFDQVRPH